MGFRVSELFVFVLTRVLVLCIKENIKQWVVCVNRIYIECIETIRYICGAVTRIIREFIVGIARKNIDKIRLIFVRYL